uniref:tRNA synthetases class I catalytic domain-containing protein n=1 Tax=Spongospora subterranea TaxID=70186 RepID=A0A0H5QTY7_9EUKA|eukprot:CRZ05473.1 hypothetical protein [Spongospora subterranea]
MGITDIDDKIVNRAKLSGSSVERVSRKFESEFLKSMAKLNVQSVDYLLRVTEHIPEIIDFITIIKRNGHAYVNNIGDVVFDSSHFHNSPGHLYGKLQPANFANDGRQSDFTLWKRCQDPDEKYWESPWGPGRPGWHIECSAMSSSVFGRHLDIHGGGIDLKFPHHNNEVAQCEACFSSNSWATQFLHTGHLHIDGVKMSKSLKNFLSVDDFLADHEPDSFRMFCLLHRYRSTIHFSDERIFDAHHVLRTFRHFNRRIHPILGMTPDQVRLKQNEADRELVHKFSKIQVAVLASLCDDFDTPATISLLLSLVNISNAYLDSIGNPNGSLIYRISSYIFSQLSSLGISHERTMKSLDENIAVELLVNFRNSIRHDILKTPPLSNLSKQILSSCDRLRQDMKTKIGIEVSDSKGGQASWSRSSPS